MCSRDYVDYLKPQYGSVVLLLEGESRAVGGCSGNVGVTSKRRDGFKVMSGLSNWEILPWDQSM